MAIQHKIKLNPAFTRSVNIQRDRDSLSTIENYVPTACSVSALRRISAAMQNGIGGAWSIVGPYGSGKSAFGVFLSALVSADNLSLHQSACKTLFSVSNELAQAYSARTSPAKVMRIHIEGTPAPLSGQIMQSLERAVLAYGIQNQALTQALKSWSYDSIHSGASPLKDCVTALELVQTCWHKMGGTGVLLQIDELGKFLEFQLHHPENSEIHLLQMLAEHSCRASKTPLYLCVYLHQSFEHYIQGAGARMRDEWHKVQGRFETIPFVEPPEQVLKLISRVFEQNSEGRQTANCSEHAEILFEAGALPKGLDQVAASELFATCFPLHPLTLLLLPVLCQKVAQNERTLFTYLGSTEPHALQAALALLGEDELLGPWSLYDYFILNQPGVTADQATRHRWMEIEYSIEKLLQAEAPEDQIKLVKAIGLLTLIGGHGGLKATLPVLRCLNLQNVESALASLIQANLLTYRKFSQEYRLWQGSDFDLASAVNRRSQEISQESVAKILNEHLPLAPIVCRKYSIEFGTIRHFRPIFMDHLSPKSKLLDDTEPKLLLYIANDYEKSLPAFDSQNNLFAFCGSTRELRAAVLEWYALHSLPKSEPLLHTDPVVHREFQHWLENSEASVKRLVHNLIQNPQSQQWIWRQSTVAIPSKRDLQHLLSKAIGDIYSRSPIIKNELINRDRVSSNGKVAINKVLSALLSHTATEDLGFQKWPPEKSVYLSVLRQGELHVKGEKGWQLSPPKPGNPLKYDQVWQGLQEFLETNKGKQVPLTAVYAHLQAPPFGVTTGVLPLFLTTYLLIEKNSVALYFEGAFCEEISSANLEMLCKRPNLFTLEYFASQGVEKDLLKAYTSEFLPQNPDSRSNTASILFIAKHIFKRLQKLPEYTWNTKRLSAQTLVIREALKKATSPGELLLITIPTLLEPFHQNVRPNAPAIAMGLKTSVEELENAYGQLQLEWQTSLSKYVLHSSSLSLVELREKIRVRYSQVLDAKFSHVKQIEPLLRRLCDRTHTEAVWLENIGSLLTQMPCKKWTDDLLGVAQLKLHEASKELAVALKLHTKLGGKSVANSVFLQWFDENGAKEELIELTMNPTLLNTQKQIELHLKGLDKQERLQLITQLLQNSSAENPRQLIANQSEADA